MGPIDDLKKQPIISDAKQEAECEEREAAPLADESLEQVSGGAVRQKDLDYCVYCRTKHTLYRYYPWRIRPAGSRTWYVNATKYVCDTMGSFYVLSQADGSTTYFDASLNRIW